MSITYRFLAFWLRSGDDFRPDGVLLLPLDWQDGDAAHTLSELHAASGGGAHGFPHSGVAHRAVVETGRVYDTNAPVRGLFLTDTDFDELFYYYYTPYVEVGVRSFVAHDEHTGGCVLYTRRAKPTDAYDAQWEPEPVEAFNTSMLGEVIREALEAHNDTACVLALTTPNGFDPPDAFVPSPTVLLRFEASVERGVTIHLLPRDVNPYTSQREPQAHSAAIPYDALRHAVDAGYYRMPDMTFGAKEHTHAA